MAGRIFHIALQREWEAAADGSHYDRSTLGRSLAEVGFVHCSRAEQWQRVRALVYAEVTEPLVLLSIDVARLDAPVIDEPATPGGTETFPHVYGALPVDAVVDVTRLGAVAASGTDQTLDPTGGRSFRSLLIAEIGIRLLLAVVVMVLTVVVAGVVDARTAPPGGFVAAVVTLVLATALAVAVYRRWDRRTPG